MVDFDLKHALYGAAGAAVGAIAGYLFGIVLYVVVLSSGALAPAGSGIGALVAQAGVFPLLFAFTLAAMGFFGGYYISAKGQAPTA